MVQVNKTQTKTWTYKKNDRPSRPEDKGKLPKQIVSEGKMKMILFGEDYCPYVMKCKEWLAQALGQEGHLWMYYLILLCIILYCIHESRIILYCIHERYRKEMSIEERLNQ